MIVRPGMVFFNSDIMEINMQTYTAQLEVTIGAGKEEELLCKTVDLCIPIAIGHKVCTGGSILEIDELQHLIAEGPNESIMPTVTAKARVINFEHGWEPKDFIGMLQKDGFVFTGMNLVSTGN